MSRFFSEMQFNEMMSLQDKMNALVDAEWRKQEYPWYRAAYMEAVETIESLSWKWWKKQDVDVENSKVEIVDILHFMLSDNLQHYKSFDDIALQEYECPDSMSKEELIDSLESFIGHCASLNSFPENSYDYLNDWMKFFGMSHDEVYKLYVVKNTLNIFRQHNGYKTGGYVKVWNGVEDNAVVMKIAEQLNSGGTLTSTGLYRLIELAYEEAKHE